MLDPNDEVVVYDSNPRCVARLQAYRVLKNHGRGPPGLRPFLTPSPKICHLADAP